MPGRDHRASNGLLIAFALVVLAGGLWWSNDSVPQHADAGLSPGDSGPRVAGADSRPELAQPTFAAANPIAARSPGVHAGAREVVEASVPVKANATVRGRVLMGLLPVSGASLTLSRDDPSSRNLDYQKLGWLGGTSTARDGSFRFRSLLPGSYLLRVDHVNAHAPAMQRFELKPGEDRRLDHVTLQARHLTPAEERARLEPARLVVRGEEAGLRVVVKASGKSGGDYMGRTDRDGELRFGYDSRHAIRIELQGKDNFVHGATGGFEGYPPGVETVIEIPSTTGSLQLVLPPRAAVVAGEAVQYLVGCDEFAKPISISETVRGTSPVWNRRSLKAQAGSLEFERLRPAKYTIEALRMLRHDSGRWYPTGERWRGVAQVRPGAPTRCDLR